MEYLSKTYGYDQMRFIDATETAWMTKANHHHGALLDLCARHLHPLKYAFGLAKAADLLCANIFENSRVLSYDESKNGQVQVKTSDGTVNARFLVLACNGYLGKL